MGLNDVLDQVGIGVKHHNESHSGEDQQNAGQYRNREEPDRRYHDEQHEEQGNQVGFQAKEGENQRVLDDVLKGQVHRHHHQVGVEPHEHQQHLHQNAEAQRNCHGPGQASIDKVPDKGDGAHRGDQRVQQPEQKALLEVALEGVKEIGDHEDGPLLGEVPQDVGHARNGRADGHDGDTAETEQQIQLYQFPEFPPIKLEKEEKSFFPGGVFVHTWTWFAVIEESEQCHFNNRSFPMRLLAKRLVDLPKITDKCSQKGKIFVAF